MSYYKIIDTEPSYAVKWKNCKVMGPRNTLLRQYIVESKLEEIKILFKKYKTIINSPILVNGFTALHLACMINNSSIVELLVEDYNADIDVVAKDGIQPIHVSCFNSYRSIVETLLKAGVNVETKVTKNMYLKHKQFYSRLENTKWCDEFGDTVTLLTFDIMVTNQRPALCTYFLSLNANLRVTSLKNTTLLMHACRKGVDLSGVKILHNLDRKYVNARDNDGFTAAHYLLRSHWFESISYRKEITRAKNLMTLVNLGANINAIANGDPDSFLVNMAAKKGFYKVLEVLLPCYSFITKSKALNNVIQILSDFKYTEEIFLNYFEWGFVFLNEEYRKISTMLILIDLVNRLAFGLFVPENEVKLMNESIEKYPEVKKFVNNYREKSINGILKNNVIHYGDITVTYYELISSIVDNKKLRSLIRNETFLDAYKKSELYLDNVLSFCDINFQRGKEESYVLYFRRLIKVRIEQASERIELFEKLKNVQQLRKAVPLPYELIIEITQYLDNYEFADFISAFYINT